MDSQDGSGLLDSRGPHSKVGMSVCRVASLIAPWEAEVSAGQGQGGVGGEEGCMGSMGGLKEGTLGMRSWVLTGCSPMHVPPADGPLLGQNGPHISLPSHSLHIYWHGQLRNEAAWPLQAQNQLPSALQPLSPAHPPL